MSDPKSSIFQRVKDYLFDNLLVSIGIVYFLIGIIFAFVYALFYHWGPLSFFSPGFYSVVLTWPLQIPGFIADFQIYGFEGKTLI